MPGSARALASEGGDEGREVRIDAEHFPQGAQWPSAVTIRALPDRILFHLDLNVL